MTMATGKWHIKRFIISCIMLCLIPFTSCWVSVFTGCGPVLDPEEPIFRWEIDLPTDEKSTAAVLTIHQGTTVILPVSIVSTREEPIEVSLNIDREEESPEAITITVPEGHVSVPTGERVTVNIVYYVGETVAPGQYHTVLMGTLREPIEGVAGIARAIDIIVTDKPYDTNVSLLQNGN